jgi:hypothetical protein
MNSWMILTIRDKTSASLKFQPQGPGYYSLSGPDAKEVNPKTQKSDREQALPDVLRPAARAVSAGGG